MVNRGHNRRRSRPQHMAMATRGRKPRRSAKLKLKLTGRLLGLLLVVLLMAGLGWCGKQLPRLFTQSDSFRLQALEVSGLHLLTGADILTASGLRVGDNIFAVDLGQVDTHLEHSPWIKQALVIRRPPDRLRIHIVERRRLAWINLGTIYGVDADGVLLPGERRPGEASRDLDLPVISGLSCASDSLQPGAVVPDSTLGPILTWWQQASVADPEFCMNISEIQPLATDSVRLLLVGDGLEVRLPVDRVPERLRILKRMMKKVYREGPAPAYIDMRFAGQVVVGSKEGDGSKEQGGSKEQRS
jgi:cell division septal protein FtsQ